MHPAETPATERDLDRLCATVEAFCGFVNALPARDLREQDWGPREVLAHLLFHHEGYVAQAEARLAGIPHRPLQGRFREINAAAVQSLRGVAVTEMTSRLQAANQRLGELCRMCDPDGVVIELKQGSKPRSLAGLIPEVEAHIRNHLVKLRQGRAGKSKSKASLARRARG